MLKEARQLRREGRLDEGMQTLRRALAGGLIEAHQLDAAGRYVLDILAAADGPRRDYDVRLLGQCTTNFLTTVLTAVGAGNGLLLATRDGGYDRIVQDLSAEQERIDVTVLIPWHQHLLAPGERSPQARIADELALFRTAWELHTRAGGRLVQVGYDWAGPGPGGFGLSGAPDGAIGLVRAMNEALREALPPDACFVDLDAIAGMCGRHRFYDRRGYYWTKQPFSGPGLALLARHLVAAIRAITTGPRKVLVLDLDGTVWGGVVAEEGPLGIALGDSPDGEAFRAFQHYCKSLAARGIVLTVSSKNNLADAREPFAVNPDMVLSLSDFAAFEANWEPKSQAIRGISQTLNLGLDSFVFIDDNPAERAEVRMALPAVDVVELPPDPADYVTCLEQGLYFEAVSASDADRARTRQYQVEAERRAEQSNSASIEAYLQSLAMIAEVRKVCAQDMLRVVQLLGKTNQFNLTTRRHSTGDVDALLANPGSLGLTLRLRDRFGDHGVVGVVLGVALENARVPTLRLDTWLMSCRVIARSVEALMMNCVAAAASGMGYAAIQGEYLPSAKNAIVATMYADFGFTPNGPIEPDGYRFVLPLAGYQALETYASLA